MLGWKILKNGAYRLSLPELSKDEEELVIKIEDRFKEQTRERKITNKKDSENLIRELIVAYASNGKLYLDREQIEYLTKVCRLHGYGYCFLEELLNDRNIEEISIIGTNKPAYVYIKNKGWQSVNACFTEEKTITDVVNKMAHNIGRRITLQNPRIDAVLPNGDRLHASLSPVSEGEITIRKFREIPFSPRELCENSTVNAEALAFLSVIMQSDSSIIIAGNTASGKTTTLNALFSFVPLNERVIITEQTPEINIPHKHQLRLIANSDMGITLSDLVYDSLRMRPDRMIVGEVRNKTETDALMDVLLAGQARGTYATMHAQSAEEALQRLKSFGVNSVDLKSIDCLVVQRRMLRYDLGTKRNVEIRRVVEIAEINGDNNNAANIIFSYDYKNDKLLAKKNELLSRITNSFGMSEKELKKEIERREKLIKSLQLGFVDFFKGVQKDIYGLNYEYY